MPGNETTVTDDDLAKSLQALTQVARTTSAMAKGEDGANNVAHSGTMSDGKPSGGGRGSVSDAGALETLMIAKMSEAGASASFIAKMVKKLREGDDEDEDMQAFMGANLQDPSDIQVPRPSPTNKSMREENTLRKAMEEMRDVPEINDAVDVSSYLEGLTATVAEMVDGMRKSITAGQGKQDKFNHGMAKAVVGLASLVKSQSAHLAQQSSINKVLAERLGIVERAPVAQPRGATTLPQAAALAKGLPAEAGGSAVGDLRKSEVISTLGYMNLEKGMKDIYGHKTVDILCQYEGGGELANEHLQAVRQFLAANPNEAAQARSYQ